jgi:hypothetical protein
VIRQNAANLGQIEGAASVVVYATGSIGRQEAGLHSDLDVFCVDVADDASARISHLDSIRLFSDLIAVNQSNGFPPFSNDGQFLDVHPIEDLLELLGTSSDDYRNLFTARMLLLLESEPIFGQAAYDEVVERVIDLYWRQCDDASRFKPTLLINDLIRYWKTLCLAHEAKRNQDPGKPKLRVDVLKLEFNRMWMVFNGLAYFFAYDAHYDEGRRRGERFGN